MLEAISVPNSLSLARIPGRAFCKSLSASSTTVFNSFIWRPVKSSFIASINNYDIVNELGKENIKKTVGEEFKKWAKSLDEYDYEYERLEKKLGKLEEERPTEKDLTPLYDFVNSGWKNIYDTLDCKQKRALWRSVIYYIEVNVPTKEFEIKFI